MSMFVFWLVFVFVFLLWCDLVLCIWEVGYMQQHPCLHAALAGQPIYSHSTLSLTLPALNKYFGNLLAQIFSQHFVFIFCLSYLYLGDFNPQLGPLRISWQKLSSTSKFPRVTFCFATFLPSFPPDCARHTFWSHFRSNISICSQI